MRPLVAVCMVAVLATNTVGGQSQFSIERPSLDVVVFAIGGTKYGSLEFDGAIQRVDMGTEWEFRIRLFATFHANTRPNQTDKVDLAILRLVGTNPRTD